MTHVPVKRNHRNSPQAHSPSTSEAATDMAGAAH